MRGGTNHLISLVLNKNMDREAQPAKSGPCRTRKPRHQVVIRNASKRLLIPAATQSVLPTKTV
jgi:hypothetical protein